VIDRPYLDSLGMWEAATRQPEQLISSLAGARDALAATVLPDAGAVRSVAAFGQGTGGTACEAAATLAAPHLGVPMWVGHGAEVPAFVDSHTLVLAVSCGEDADATTAAREAVARGAPVVAVGSDGGLARLAADAGLPWCPIDAAGAPARAALAAATVPLLVALARAVLAPDPTASIAAARRISGEFTRLLTPPASAALAVGGSKQVASHEVRCAIANKAGAQRRRLSSCSK